MNLHPLVYTDAGGTAHHFWLEFEEATLNSVRCWYFDVWPTPDVILGTSPYQARFDELDSTTIQSSSLENNGNAWAMKVGLSEEIFEQASRRIGRKIVSSRPWVEGGGEWRTPLAEGMWRRFERSGRACYDESERRFHYIPSERP